MNRTITPEESRKLFQFCQNHFVYHYDLQAELVDHLASAIEEQWALNPEIPFQDALNNSFSRFGITGFSKVKEQKQKELQRKYTRLQWKYFLEFYRWPKVLMTFVLTLSVYLLMYFTQKTQWLVAISFLTYGAFGVWYFFRGYKKYRFRTKRKFLLLSHLKQIQLSILIFPVFLLNALSYFHLLSEQPVSNPAILFLISFALTGISFMIYVQFIVIPQKIRDHFFEQFPGFAE